MKKSGITHLQQSLKGATKIKHPGGLSSGSYLINLSCTGNANIAYHKGSYVILIGDSNSGKSWEVVTALAEATINPGFDGYSLIYDGPERGAKMNLKKHFPSLLDRLQAPSYDEDGYPMPSSNIEEFYDNLDDALAKGPCVYVLDSIDALSSEDEEKKAKQNKSIRRKKAKKTSEGSDAIEVKGSYGDGKAKKNSNNLRRFIKPLEKTGSILLIVNQSRDKFGFMVKPGEKTHAGGHALEFYADTQMWFSIRERIKAPVRGKLRSIGTLCKIHIKRTRHTGYEGSVEVPIFKSSGIDNLGSCIDWLVDEKYWKRTKGGEVKRGFKGNYSLEAPEFDHVGTREQLVKLIENTKREKELRQLVSQLWKEIEEACAVPRKNRYTREIGDGSQESS